MHKIIIQASALMLIILSSFGAEAQVIGMWRSIDDRDGSEKGMIEIYEQNGMLYGKVVKLLKGSTYTTCSKCEGDLKDKPLVGMTIIYDLKKTATGGTGGSVIDPNNGKTYSCYVELENADKLKIRGYIGIPALGRTQYWNRVE
ncbi:MAG TPA: DUF2147 domain-containing protein [Saprospiraceae bacterium]|nr:DUF2147 domain-containing protein [Saprospiraceae bacterium]